MIKLSENELTVLLNLASNNMHDSAEMIGNKIKTRSLSSEHIEQIQDIILDELCSLGLKIDDEPNSYGFLLDNIVGKLEYYQKV